MNKNSTLHSLETKQKLLAHDDHISIEAHTFVVFEIEWNLGT